MAGRSDRYSELKRRDILRRARINNGRLKNGKTIKNKNNYKKK